MQSVAASYLPQERTLRVEVDDIQIVIHTIAGRLNIENVEFNSQSVAIWCSDLPVAIQIRGVVGGVLRGLNISPSKDPPLTIQRDVWSDGSTTEG